MAKANINSAQDSMTMAGQSQGHAGGGGFSIDDGFENDKVKAMKELLRRDNIPGQHETGGYQSISPMKKSSMIRNVSPTSGFKTPSQSHNPGEEPQTRVVFGGNTGLSLGQSVKRSPTTGPNLPGLSGSVRKGVWD